MSASAPPGPPKVHAPHRLSADGASGDGTSSDAVLTTAGPASAAAGTGTPRTTEKGATVTASVGGTSKAPPTTGAPGVPTTGVPTTGVPTQAPPVPTGGLARAGADLGLVLTFALLAVLIGAVLVRLGHPRPRHTPTPEGAPCSPTAAH